MTDLATALANPVGNLGYWRDRPILRSEVAILNAGDGLSKSMRTKPQKLDLGQEVYILMKGQVTEVAEGVPLDRQDLFGPVKCRHKITAQTVLIVEDEIAAVVVAEQVAAEEARQAEIADRARQLEGQGTIEDALLDGEEEVDL